MNRMFVIGDIHGAYRALRQCLDKAQFDYRNDHLICLGDVADGWPDTKTSFDELLRINNLTYVLGNHDWWTLQWMKTGKIDEVWYRQGGKATIQSYADGVPDAHIQLLSKAPLYFRKEKKVFVHAGIDPLTPLEMQHEQTLLWDRTLALLALDVGGRSPGSRITSFEEVYVGHTPVTSRHPIHSRGVWLMDTGAGWSGVLSMMNIETKETFISDPVPTLYPGVEGRKKSR